MSAMYVFFIVAIFLIAGSVSALMFIVSRNLRSWTDLLTPGMGLQPVRTSTSLLTCPTGKIGHRADGLEVAEHDVIGPDGRPTGARVWVAADGRTFEE